MIEDFKNVMIEDLLFYKGNVIITVFYIGGLYVA